MAHDPRGDYVDDLPLSQLLHEVIEKLAERGEQGDPDWKMRWREVVSKNSGRFSEYLTNTRSKTLATVPPTLTNWVRLLKIEDDPEGRNYMRYLDEPN